MSSDAEQNRGKDRAKIPGDFPAAPLTLEGYSILHQMFRVRRRQLRALDSVKRDAAINEASKLFGEMARREDGETALFSAIGHKGDLMIVHFRRSFEELGQAEHAVAALALSDYLEPTTSYLSVIEIGLYEATVALYRKLIENESSPSLPVSAKRFRRGCFRKSPRGRTCASIRWTRSATAPTTGIACRSKIASV